MKSAKIKSKLLFLFVAVTMAAYAMVNVLVAFCMMNAVDAAIALDMDLFGRTVLYTIGIAVMEFATGMTSRYALRTYCRSKVTQAKENRYMQLLYHGRTEEMDISGFSTDIDLLYNDNYFNRCILICEFIQFVLSVGSIIFLSWKIALIVFATTFLPFLVPALFRKKLQKATQDYTEGMNAYLDFVQDTLQGIQEIRTYRAFGFFGRLHGEKNRRAENLRLKSKMAAQLNASVSTLVSSLSFVATIAICGFLTVKGEITMGVLIAVIQLLNSVVGPIGNISAAFGALSSTKNLLQKYEALPETNLTAAGKPVAQINVKHLSYTYDGQTPVLSDINLHFERGRRYAVLGESGAGKSTLAKVLAGNLPGYEGQVLLTDSDGMALEAEEVQHHIQYVAQEPYLFKISAQDNVYFGEPEEKGRMQERMKNLGIKELFEDPQAQLANRERISGGQKQRLVLARALYHTPDVLILDEPTANLDSETAKQVIDYIMSEKYGMLIVITHDASKAFLAKFDEVIELKQSVGRLSISL